MKVIGVIPARWGSTRFEGKILAPIAGKPMIQHVWERVQKCKLMDDLLIACDDQRILSVAEEFGAKAVLTSPDHATGTDRIIEAVKDLDVDVIINIQGDEPLIDPQSIDDLIHGIVNDDYCLMATLIKRIEDRDEIDNPNVVKVTADRQGNALYFSRCAIPYNRDNVKVIYYKHLGIYAYRKEFLLTFKDLPESHLEKIEKLEQLRVLDAGYKIKVIVTDKDTVGVDTQEDLDKVEKMLND